MISHKLYNNYLEGGHVDVWKEISFLEFDKMEKEEQSVVNRIIQEVLFRVDYNIKVVFDIYNRNEFELKDFGNINSFKKSYLLRNQSNYEKMIAEFVSSNELAGKVPLFFASFSVFFRVVDFRGTFGTFKVDFLLDSLFIETADSVEDLNERTFEIIYNGEFVFGCMFSPDQFIKENASGDLGPCILLNKNTLVDNFVGNYSEDMPMTFIEYLRFCFHWACMPNLFWASDIEREPFLPILEEVRQSIKLF